MRSKLHASFSTQHRGSCENWLSSMGRNNTGTGTSAVTHGEGIQGQVLRPSLSDKRRTSLAPSGLLTPTMFKLFKYTYCIAPHSESML
jgi:hypothetical protein